VPSKGTRDPLAPAADARDGLDPAGRGLLPVRRRRRSIRLCPLPYGGYRL